MSKFITETEIAEAKQKRQEEWEKVRTNDEPLEVPEEQYDGRSLFDKLQEQKNKKDLEYEEAHKLKNMIKGLDDDEVEFLDLVDKNKMDAERKQQMEEKKEMSDFRQKVASLQEKRLDEKLQLEISKPKPKASISSSRLSQKKILEGVVVKKRKADTENIDKGKAKTRCLSGSEPASNGGKTENTEAMRRTKGLQVIGILPGLGTYRESTDSEESSDSDDDANDFDWIGRKIVKEKIEHK